VIVFKKPPQDEVHIEDVKQVNGQWLVAGTSGVILIVVGMGPTMRQAQSPELRLKDGQKCTDDGTEML
jgi:phosphoribosylamine--glycine ligase